MTVESVQTPEETEIRALYKQLLDSWNKHSAPNLRPCEEDGNQIGFDGSQVNGQQISNLISARSR